MSRSGPDDPSTADPVGDASTVLHYPGADWRLLVRLPGRVLIAALADQTQEPSVRVRSAVAGLEAIAAGRLFDSDLVRMIANAIYAESCGEPTGSSDRAGWAPGRVGETPGSIQVSDEVAAVLSACRAAVAVLGHGADPADSAAYRHWVQLVAARTGGPASGFVADLGRALGLTAGA